jgi:antitoxin ParD1/3/4
MQISLSPESINLVKAQIQSGKFASAEEVIAIALKLLVAHQQDYADWVIDTRQKVEIGLGQIERGEVLDGEVVITQLKARLQQKQAAQS